ncbi:hypothetical protein [Streptomyces sp. NPDC093109]|uniref:hypothetical protein n=1 Tax=Streptomyces sp. NPDC093109 TaxID=3154977 RepID=UPI003450EC3C
MTDGTTWLADRQSIAFGGYRVVLARGLSPQKLAERLAADLRYALALAAVRSVGNHSPYLMVMSVPPAYRVGMVRSASGRS